MQPTPSKSSFRGAADQETLYDATHRAYRCEDWLRLVGGVVDVWCGGTFLGTGIVEDTTPTGDTAWIAANGIEPRIMISKAAGHELLIAPIYLQPRSTTRRAKTR
ncbi:MAG TPA: hypothetical protein VGK98_06355 [Arthrobacter sp.]|jgi:hypothetical protein|uniref:hypothetical protein n=1 Tax=Arthrobacter sp. TaxID=1667 RepID=UPI002F40A718